MPSSDTQHSLRGSRIPRDWNNATAKDKAAVSGAIRGLHALAEDIRAETKSDSVTKYLKRNWDDGIFPWLVFAFDNYNTLDFPVSNASASCWHIASYISCILAYAGLGTDISHTFSKTTASWLGLATRLYLVTDFDDMRSEYSIYHGLWEPYLKFMNYTTIDDDTIRGIVTNVDGSGTTALVDLSMERLRFSKRLPTCPYQQHAGLIHALRRFDYLDPDTGVPLNRFIRNMVTTFRYMVYNIPNYSGIQKHGLAVECNQMITIIGRKLSVSNCISAVCEALDYGLLQAFAEFSQYLGTPLTTFATYPEATMNALASATRLLSSVITRYMIFKSVGLSLQRTFSDGHYDYKVRDTIVWKEWEELRGYYQSNIRLYNDPSEYLFITFCDNSKHDINYKSEKIFECAHCKSVWYCSAKCQREHWKDQHREVCIQLQRILEEETSIYDVIRRRDYRSACRAALISVQAGDEVHIALDQINPAEPWSEISVHLDYTVHPERIGYGPREKSAAMVANHIPNSTVIDVILPVGRRFVKISLIGNLDSTTTGWITGKTHIRYLELEKRLI